MPTVTKPSNVISQTAQDFQLVHKGTPPGPLLSLTALIDALTKKVDSLVTKDLQRSTWETMFLPMMLQNKNPKQGLLPPWVQGA